MSNTPDTSNNLDQWIDWLLHLHAQEIDLGLDRIRQVAQKMDLLQPAKTIISVAGTNGKGSSVTILSSILVKAGYKVGTYTSPHIERFNERIQLNNQLATDEQIITAFDLIERSRGDIKLTYFEFSTLAALQIFKESQLDVVVLEVGLGGRLDAVNIVDADAALITSIDVDHIDWLGDDRGQIALEKAGITRSGHLAVCSDPHPPETLDTYCQNHSVPLRQLGRDFEYTLQDTKWHLKTEAVEMTLPLPALKGDFQVQNASGVVTVLVELQTLGCLNISEFALEQGLKSTVHPGRLQSLKFQWQGKYFHWLIDVAHNPQSAQVLADYLHKSKLNKLQTIFSVLDDKDASPMVQLIAPFIAHWHSADLQIPRSSSEQKLTNLLSDVLNEDKSVQFYTSLSEAVGQYLQSNGHSSMPSTPDLLVWGSFFTVSQVRQVLTIYGVEIEN